MDLLAYVNIENLENILTENNIQIPRLRGLDLCSEMKPFTKKEIKEIKNSIAIETCRGLCESRPFWLSRSSIREYSSWTSLLCDLYLIKNPNYLAEDENVEDRYVKYSGINWNKIHGWKRKVLKTEIHNATKKILDYVEVWNKYCGREDALRVHARIGGGNWPYYYKDENGVSMSTKPWFIERVDDYFDSTYCDIYVKIK